MPISTLPTTTRWLTRQASDDAANQRKVSTGINQDGVPAKGGSAAEAREKMAARMRGEKVEDDQ